MEVFSKNQQIIDGELDGNQVMMHIEKGKYFGLTPVGKRIWDLVEQPKSFDEITGILLSEYEITKDQCEQEVRQFLDKAVQYNIIIKGEQHP